MKTVSTYTVCMLFFGCSNLLGMEAGNFGGFDSLLVIKKECLQEAKSYFRKAEKLFNDKKSYRVAKTAFLIATFKWDSVAYQDKQLLGESTNYPSIMFNPLYLAVLNKDVNFVKFLLRHRANPFLAEKADKSPIDLLLSSNFTVAGEKKRYVGELIDLFLQNNALKLESIWLDENYTVQGKTLKKYLLSMPENRIVYLSLRHSEIKREKSCVAQIKD